MRGQRTPVCLQSLSCRAERGLYLGGPNGSGEVNRKQWSPARRDLEMTFTAPGLGCVIRWVRRTHSDMNSVGWRTYFMSGVESLLNMMKSLNPRQSNGRAAVVKSPFTTRVRKVA